MVRAEAEGDGMNSIALCRICKKQILTKKANAFYCDKCERVLYERGARRYKISDDTWVWCRSSIMRAVVKGKNVIPIYEGYEVLD